MVRSGAGLGPVVTLCRYRAGAGLKSQLLRHTATAQARPERPGPAGLSQSDSRGAGNSGKIEIVKTK